MSFFLSAKQLYSGFFISNPVGNNAFSFDVRFNNEIFVAPLIEGTLDDLQEGEKIVFSEIVDQKEVNCHGLKHFVYWYNQGKHIFIFDNHNHAFFFWVLGFKNGWFKSDSSLVHIDQHTDMRQPPKFMETFLEKLGLEEVFDYTNFVLNVGNFIKPALDKKLFSNIKMINTRDTLNNDVANPYVVDLDMDFFNDDMAYIDENYRINRIKSFINKSNFVTVATSPFFINQTKAIDCIKKIFY